MFVVFVEEFTFWETFLLYELFEILGVVKVDVLTSSTFLFVNGVKVVFVGELVEGKEVLNESVFLDVGVLDVDFDY